MCVCVCGGVCRVGLAVASSPFWTAESFVCVVHRCDV